MATTSGAGSCALPHSQKPSSRNSGPVSTSVTQGRRRRGSEDEAERPASEKQPVGPPARRNGNSANFGLDGKASVVCSAFFLRKQTGSDFRMTCDRATQKLPTA